MKTFCLPPKDVAKFRMALKNKAIDIADLINMDTAKRIEFLKNYAGDLAPEVNHLFEQKLVLKNRMQGIKNWASKVGEIGRYSPEKKAQIEQMMQEYRDKQFERTFSPKEHEVFLNDLADAKLGTHVTKAEAKQIFDLYQTADNFKKNYNKDTETWPSPKDKLDYGMAQVQANRYIESLKTEELSIAEMAKRRAGEFKEDWQDNKVAAVGKIIKDVGVELDKNSIAMVASIDNSFIARQGLDLLQTHPSAWKDGAIKSFTDIYKSLKEKHGNEKAKDVLHADLVSRPNYMNGNYQKAGILASFEEQYPTSHPARVPYLGRAFKASEVAFTSSAVRMRINYFDLMHDIAKKNGVDINEAWLKDGGKVINAITKRSDIGKGAVLNLVLWAPRMMWANVQVLTAHGLTGGLKTAFWKKEAAKNLLKITAETATVVAFLNALNPGSVETDPRSSDFLKYRQGNTRIDLTGGRSQYIILLARQLSGQTKNAQTKIIKELGTGKKGAPDRVSVGIDFLINKTTPLVRTGVYLGRERNFEGKKPTALTTAADLTVPIPVRNFYQNVGGDYPENDAVAIVGSVLDLIGVNANTYEPNKHWDGELSKELESFKKRVGEERFKKANIKYNLMVNQAIGKEIKRPSYQRMSDEEKQNRIEKIRRDEKRKIIGR
ncbi:MAG: hypothetical protein WC332_02995 [Clostridia bacterium]|jgi:hypothetical protein